MGSVIEVGGRKVARFHLIPKREIIVGCFEFHGFDSFIKMPNSLIYSYHVN